MLGSDDVAVRSSLLFEHSTGERQDSGDNTGAITKLQQLCSTTVNDIRQDTPRLFSELVHELKKLDSSALNDVYRTVQQDDFCANNARRLRYAYSCEIIFYLFLILNGLCCSCFIIANILF